MKRQSIFDHSGNSYKASCHCLAVIIFLLLSACSSDEVAYKDRSVGEIYNHAMARLLNGDLKSAIIEFEEVERQHPYSVWARKSQLMAAYSQYLAKNYDDAIFAAQRFMQLHPGHQDAPYAVYLIAISYYEQIADVGREQRITELALKALQKVVNLYPKTEYASDARLKIDLALDHLAGKEMEIGRYYLNRGHHGAAINRFRHVVKNYQTTSHVPEALHRLTEAYMALGVVGEAENSAAVLGHNYPGSEWYVDSYALLTGKNLRIENVNDHKPWYGRLWTSIF